MNKLINILTIVLFCSIQVDAQEWGQLFVTQEMSELESKLSDDLSVKVDSEKRTKSRASAIKQLKEKLSAFNPVSVNRKHKGSSDKREDYYIAELVNSSGDKMRLFLHLENSSEGKKICDIKLREL